VDLSLFTKPGLVYIVDQEMLLQLYLGI
jgi:hypothetical protein